MTPHISVIIPAYHSHATALQALSKIAAQTEVSFEIIVVDSSPDDQLGRKIRLHVPEVRYFHSSRRLLPHAARNLGALHARGKVLVFTDPDAYPHHDWLARLLRAHEATGAIIAGAVACYGQRWFDHGVHLTKYGSWLPGGNVRRVTVAPTVNVLYPADLFADVGGFNGDLMLGDTELSWRMLELGHPMWFEPGAIVEHHHLANWSGFLAERYSRGRLTGELWAELSGWSRPRLLLWIIFSLLLLRAGSQVLRSGLNAARTRHLPTFLATLPVICAGRVAWVLGEAHGYWSYLVAHRTGQITPSGSTPVL